MAGLAQRRLFTSSQARAQLCDPSERLGGLLYELTCGNCRGPSNIVTLAVREMSQQKSKLLAPLNDTVRYCVTHKICV